jgi:hypothetical protein
MRIPIALTATLLLLPGCTERKQASFDECHRIFIKPSRGIPEKLKLDSIDLCMKAEGYVRDEATCPESATLTAGCFSTHPLLLVMSVITKPGIQSELERESQSRGETAR